MVIQLLGHGRAELEHRRSVGRVEQMPEDGIDRGRVGRCLPFKLCVLLLRNDPIEKLGQNRTMKAVQSGKGRQVSWNAWEKRK